jgi:hypothetical protein
VVLDVSDPTRPVETDRLLELPALSPHESLNLNKRRGLLAAVNGNPLTLPGVVAIWDLSRDCRHPVLKTQGLHARFGHESGFSHDGRTFYATSTALPQITALDVSDPAQPEPVWVGNLISHGMSLSKSGNRAYVADVTGGNMLILDTSEIQAREPNPRAREISRITWTRPSLPQNAIPFRQDGGRYVLEIDEYTAAAGGTGGGEHDVGAARIIDIGDERHPRVVSNLRLQVNQPEDHRLAAAEDPGNMNPLQGYAAHYCDISSPVDPTVVACSFIASGLRVFDVSNVERPKEIAYFVAPTKARYENFGEPSNYAMSKPVVVPRRREVWFSDGASGFYTLRVDRSVWPR